MSHSSKLPFSVVNFTIEGVEKGAAQSHTPHPAPPRLPGPQTTPLSKPELAFPINPFSLSRSVVPA